MSSTKTANSLKFTPIGGVGEIGSNMAHIITSEASFLIDAGILFPNDDAFGIDYLIPDLNSLEKNPTDLIITHGHEDHIGAVVHVVKKYPDITVWASPFTMDLIKKKLHEKSLSAKTQLYLSKSIITIGDVDITPVQMNHSIPETHGLLVKHGINTLFYASDFKIDTNKLDEPVFDQSFVISELSKAKKRSLFIDSTNIQNKGKTGSELEVFQNLSTLISNNKDRRIFITLFASNIYRLKHILLEAVKHQLPITIIGRSIHKYIQSAEDTGLIPKNINLTDEDFAAKSERGLFILSGCQGDFFSAFRRLAMQEHAKIKLRKGDLFLYSSKVIPGNEKKVYRLFNKIVESGAELITTKEWNIHSSGHPGQLDLVELLGPINFHCDYFPIHGESLFLQRHADFIKNNFPNLTPHTIYNSWSVTFHQDREFVVTQHEIVPPVLIHGNGLEIEREKISERRKLASRGLAIVAFSIQSRKLVLETQGLPVLIDQNKNDIFDTINDFILLHLSNNHEKLQEEIRVFTMRIFDKYLGYRPICKVVLL